MGDVLTFPLARRAVPHNRDATVIKARESGRAADLVAMHQALRTARRAEREKAAADPLAFAADLVERVVYALPTDRRAEALAQLRVCHTWATTDQARRAVARLLRNLGDGSFA